jgi:hypothetical protein
MVASKELRPCLYCGTPTKKGKKGEHIFPEAIGCARTLNDAGIAVVCQDCNNGVLSHIDRELCSRSYLSAVASQEIEAKLWHTWDVDHAAGHLLVEARPWWHEDRTLNGLVCYPQITFERSGPAVRGDYTEFQSFGQENSSRVLFKSIRHCFERWCAEGKGLHFERVRSGVITDGYRLPPRVYTPHPISEIARNVCKHSFVLRFATEEDKRFALLSLSKLGESKELKQWSYKPGSRLPTICFYFDIGESLRALMKIGLNLIATYCHNTSVNREAFLHPIRAIMGEIQIPPTVMASNGFVHAEDIQEIRGAPNEHSFRLAHADRVWHVYSCFFGGRIGAYVRIPGPNGEQWNCADIVAPLKSKKWNMRISPIIQLLPSPRVDWSHSQTVVPSLKLQRTTSSVQVEFEAAGRQPGSR